MYSGEEGCRVLGVACGNAAPFFQMQKRILDEMAKTVEILVVFSRLFAVLPGWNHGLHPCSLCLFNEGITVITFIRNQAACIDSFNQFASLGTIRCGTCCNKHSDRQTLRIHGQMYL